ncbi:hypothetical protein BJX64DRAFT_128514 [Aspergillus heterothallicus]
MQPQGGRRENRGRKFRNRKEIGRSEWERNKKSEKSTEAKDRDRDGRTHGREKATRDEKSVDLKLDKSERLIPSLSSAIDFRFSAGSRETDKTRLDSALMP